MHEASNYSLAMEMTTPNAQGETDSCSDKKNLLQRRVCLSRVDVDNGEQADQVVWTARCLRPWAATAERLRAHSVLQLSGFSFLAFSCATLLQPQGQSRWSFVAALAGRDQIFQVPRSRSMPSQTFSEAQDLFMMREAVTEGS